MQVGKPQRWALEGTVSNRPGFLGVTLTAKVLPKGGVKKQIRTEQPLPPQALQACLKHTRAVRFWTRVPPGQAKDPSKAELGPQGPGHLGAPGARTRAVGREPGGKSQWSRSWTE